MNYAASVFIYPEDGGTLFTSKLHVVTSTSLHMNALIQNGNADKGRTFLIHQMAELYRKLNENIFSYIATRIKQKVMFQVGRYKELH